MRRILLIAAVFVLAAVFPSLISAKAPGSSADPLISKSYIDQFFRFKSMVIAGGGKIELNMGALIVVRSGKVRLIAKQGRSLVDLTAGKEIGPDQHLPHNHLILVPDSSSYSLAAESLSLLVASGLTIEPQSN